MKFVNLKLPTFENAPHIQWNEHTAIDLKKILAKQNITQINRVIDIGGWWGGWSLHWTEQAKQIEIFEPNQEIIPALLENTQQFRHITVHQTALYKGDGTAGLQYESHSGTCHLDHGKKIDTVQLRTLDSYNFSKVDIIKIDAEGSEYFILQGAEQTIRQNKPFVQIEVTKHAGLKYKITKNRLTTLLESFGMERIYKKHPDQIWAFTK